MFGKKQKLQGEMEWEGKLRELEGRINLQLLIPVAFDCGSTPPKKERPERAYMIMPTLEADGSITIKCLREDDILMYWNNLRLWKYEVTPIVTSSGDVIYPDGAGWHSFKIVPPLPQPHLEDLRRKYADPNFAAEVNQLRLKGLLWKMIKQVFLAQNLICEQLRTSQDRMLKKWELALGIEVTEGFVNKLVKLDFEGGYVPFLFGTPDFPVVFLAFRQNIQPISGHYIIGIGDVRSIPNDRPLRLEDLIIHEKIEKPGIAIIDASIMHRQTESRMGVNSLVNASVDFVKEKGFSGLKIAVLFGLDLDNEKIIVISSDGHGVELFLNTFKSEGLRVTPSIYYYEEADLYSFEAFIQ